MKKILIFALMLSLFVTLGSAYTINGDTVSYENQYGKLSVYPHTDYGIGKHTQYLIVRPDFSGQIDIAVSFDNTVTGNIWYLKNESYEVDDWDYQYIQQDCWDDENLTYYTCNYWNKTKIGSHTEYKEVWKDITSQFTHDIHNDKHFYWVRDVTFTSGEVMRLKWTYYQNDKSGKWDLWIKRNQDSISEALSSGLYIHLDPWWNESYSYYKIINVTNNDKLVKWFTANVTVDTSTLISANKMQSDCDDLRIVYNGTEIDRNITLCNNANTIVNFAIQGNITASGYDDNYTMYYGNPSASTPTVNKSQVYAFFCDFSSDMCGLGEQDANGYIFYNGTSESLDFSIDRDADAYVYFDTDAIGGWIEDYEVFADIKFTTLVAVGSTGWGIGLGTNLDDMNGHKTNDYHGDWIMQQSQGDHTWNLITKVSDTWSDWGSTFAEGTEQWVRQTRFGTDYTGYRYSDATFSTLDDDQATTSTGTAFRYFFPINNYNSGGGADLVKGSMYNVRLLRRVDTNPSYTLGDEVSTIPDDPPNVTITYPENSTYLNDTIPLVFTPSDDVATSLMCWQILNGTITYLGNVTNGTDYSGSLAGLGTGTYNLNITCQDSNSQNGSSTALFYVKWYDIESVGFTDPVYEGNVTPISLVVNLSANVTAFHGNLTYNNTVYSFSNTSATQGLATITKYVPVPLVQTNETDILFNWDIQLNFSNGLNEVNHTGNYNHTVLYGYWFDSINATPQTALEGQNVTLDSWVYSLINNPNITYSVTTTFNTTVYTSYLNSNDTYIDIYRKRLQMPTISGADTNLTLWWNSTTTITLDGISRSFTSSSDNVSVWRIAVDNCSIFGTHVLNLSTWDEQTLLKANSTIELTARVWADPSYVKNYSFVFQKAYKYSICMSPAGINMTGNVTIQFKGENSDYPYRFYYLINQNFDNVTDNISLYMLNTSEILNRVKIRVVDEDATPIPDVFVRVLRYYTGSDEYRTVAMIKTDFDGYGLTFAKMNTILHKIQLELNDTVVKTFTDMQISGDPTDILELTLPLSLTRIGEYWYWYNSVNHNCKWNNVTGILNCTYSDTSGLSQYFRLIVQQNQSGLDWLTVCDQNSSLDSGVLNCSIGAGINGTWRYWLLGQFQESEAIIEFGSIDEGMNIRFGLMGVLVTFMIFLTLCLIGIWNPVVSMLLGGLGIVVSWMLGFFAIPMTAMMSIVLIIGLVIYKLRA